MKSIQHIMQVWYAELLDIFRDKGVFIFVIFVPLFYPLLYSAVYDNEVVREVPAVVVDDSHTSLSREFLRKVDATPDVRIVGHCSDMEEARRALMRQEAYGIIRVPESFTRDLYLGEQTYVGLYCDMSSMLYYKALMLGTTLVAQDMNRDIKVGRYVTSTTDREEEIARMPIDYEYVTLYNPQSGFASFLIPPVLMLIIQQTLLLAIGMTMGDSRERYMGSVIPFMEGYKHPLEIITGKTLAYLPVYLVLGIYMFTVVTWGFSLPSLGSLATFVAFLIPYLLACIFMGIAFSSFVFRREDCIMLFVFLSVPMLFLSGVSWPAPSMPRFWRWVSWLFPSTFGMNGYVKITSMGASIHDILPEYAALWIQTLGYFTWVCLFYARHIRLMVRRVRKPNS